MVTLTKPFRSLTARDLMTRDLLLIPREASLHHAAHLLSQSQVSGAPVVDDAGRCIGVLSTTDFMRWMDDDQRHAKIQPREHACVCSDWEVVNPESLPADEVGTFMNGDPVMASPETHVADLAHMMLDGHIHRLIVVDAEKRPIGVITSTDILAAVARSVDAD